MKKDGREYARSRRWGSGGATNAPETTGPIGMVYHEGDYVEVFEKWSGRWLSARITGPARVLSKEPGRWVNGYPVKGVGFVRLAGVPDSTGRISIFEGTFRDDLIRPRSYRWLPRQEQLKYGE